MPKDVQEFIEEFRKNKSNLEQVIKFIYLLIYFIDL